MFELWRRSQFDSATSSWIRQCKEFFSYVNLRKTFLVCLFVFSSNVSVRLGFIRGGNVSLLVVLSHLAIGSVGLLACGDAVAAAANKDQDKTSVFLATVPSVIFRANSPKFVLFYYFTSSRFCRNLQRLDLFKKIQENPRKSSWNYEQSSCIPDNHPQCFPCE